MYEIKVFDKLKYVAFCKIQSSISLQLKVKNQCKCYHHAVTKANTVRCSSFYRFWGVFKRTPKDGLNVFGKMLNMNN